MPDGSTLSSNDAPSETVSSDPDPMTLQTRAGSVVVPECLFCLNYGKLILSDTRHVFSSPLRWQKEEWLNFSLVVLGVGAAAVLDKPVFEFFQEHHDTTSNRIADLFEPFGGAYAFGILGMFYIDGIAFQNPKATAVAQDGLAASLIGQGVSSIVKRTVGRSRPREHRGSSSFRPFSGHTSFPSGHATEAFTVAAVISTHYPRPSVQILSYGIAGLAAYARIVYNAHFVSDAVAGAVIGTAVGKAVVHFNQQNRTGLQVHPLIGPELNGLSVAFRF